jgi:hypothetical protein
MIAAHIPGAKYAVAVYIEELARLIGADGTAPFSSTGKRFVLRRVISTNREWLRLEDRGWGAVGYALVMCGEYKRALAWLADYSTRREVEPWMVHNYIDACHMRGRDEDARRAIEFAISLPAFGNQINSHLLWFALEEVLDSQKPLPSLERLDSSSFTAHEERMKALLDSLTRILRGAGEKYTAQDRACIRDFVSVHPSGNKWARRYARRALAAISRKTGQWWVRLVPL